jgi:hypothetical protein
LREKKERKAAGPRVPKGTVNMATLGMRLMMHLDPSAQPDVKVPLGRSVHETVAASQEPVVYVGAQHAYVVLTPPPPKFKLDLTIRVVIVRGPKPFDRAVASVTLGEHGHSSDVKLPGQGDWRQTADPNVILDYAAELSAYDAART